MLNLDNHKLHFFFTFLEEKFNQLLQHTYMSNTFHKNLSWCEMYKVNRETVPGQYESKFLEAWTSNALTSLSLSECDIGQQVMSGYDA